MVNIKRTAHPDPHGRRRTPLTVTVNEGRPDSWNGGWRSETSRRVWQLLIDESEVALCFPPRLDYQDEEPVTSRARSGARRSGSRETPERPSLQGLGVWFHAARCGIFMSHMQTPSSPIVSKFEIGPAPRVSLGGFGEMRCGPTLAAVRPTDAAL